MTAIVYVEDREKCIEAGMIDFVPKAIELNEIIRVITTDYKQF